MLFYCPYFLQRRKGEARPRSQIPESHSQEILEINASRAPLLQLLGPLNHLNRPKLIVST